MKTPNSLVRSLVVFSLAACLGHAAEVAESPIPASTTPIPDEFKDPDTGARMLHLSKLPNDASGVIYFTQPDSTPDSRYTLVRYLDIPAGHTAGFMYRYDFKTAELVKLTDKITKNQWLVPKSGNLYYTSDNDHAFYVTNIHTLKTRKVADALPGTTLGGGVTVNADETIVLATGNLEKEHKGEKILTTAPNQGSAFTDTFSKHDTNLLFAADIKTGKMTELHRINTWLGHPQFSPTDPKLLMYCHEGPWQLVDRMWLMNLDDIKNPKTVMVRTEKDEIGGHEFWSTDGSTVWYDHNFRGKTGAHAGKHVLQGKNVKTGALTEYPIEPEFGSIHYVNSPDGKFFVCDGGTRKDPSTQAMYILVPKEGKLIAIKLCNMAKNNYKAAEPNPHLTPDQHWVTFTATFSGTPQAYAVEMPKKFWR